MTNNEATKAIQEAGGTMIWSRNLPHGQVMLWHMRGGQKWIVLLTEAAPIVFTTAELLEDVINGEA